MQRRTSIEALSGQRIKKPAGVRLGCAGDFKDKKLWRVVAVHLVYGVLKRAKASGVGLDEQQEFLGAFNIALPTIDGLDWADDIDAGGEFALDQGCRERLGLGPAANGSQRKPDGSCVEFGAAGAHLGKHLTPEQSTSMLLR